MFKEVLWEVGKEFEGLLAKDEAGTRGIEEAACHAEEAGIDWAGERSQQPFFRSRERPPSYNVSTVDCFVRKT